MGPANVVVLVLLLGVFYLLLVRPQKRRLRQHQDLMSNLVPGDEVVTIGGIIGYIQEVGEESIRLEIADGCVIRVARQAIGRKVDPDTADLEAHGEPADRLERGAATSFSDPSEHVVVLKPDKPEAKPLPPELPGAADAAEEPIQFEQQLWDDAEPEADTTAVPLPPATAAAVLPAVESTPPTVASAARGEPAALEEPTTVTPAPASAPAPHGPGEPDGHHHDGPR